MNSFRNNLVNKYLLLIIFLLPLLLTGCHTEKEPIILNLWHNFGGIMQQSMDELVDEFNTTIGKEEGIRLNVVSVADTATIREKLTMIAEEIPGSPEMPDLTTCYPQTAVILQARGLLCSLEEYFTEAELDAYLPRFIEEGRFAGGLYVFPIAKSSEVLFVNQTLFDEFSAATGIKLESLSTFEGLAYAAQEYYLWTSSIAGGKDFFAADSLINLAQVGMQQLGGELILENRLQLTSNEFAQVWETILTPAVKGGYKVYSGYSSDLSKTGEIVCSIGSTAGILFYGSEITYPDNTIRQVAYTILPYPVFEGGKKIALQRGGGMVVAKSTPEKEKAAAVFLKWFTAPKQNMKFVSSTGYLPVTNEAFQSDIAQEIEANDNETIRKLLRVALTLHREYDFYIPPVFEEFDSLSKSFETDIKALFERARDNYFYEKNILLPEDAYIKTITGLFEEFISTR